MSLSLMFLGTCACDFSKRLEEDLKYKFDKTVRRASCALFEGHILIDCGPHCLNSLEIAKIEKSAITDIVFTHLHDDHFNVENVAEIAKNRSEPLKVWLRYDAEFPTVENVELRRVKPFEEYNIGNIKLTTLYANHDKLSYPQHLLFEKENEKLFYGLDGGWMDGDTYRFLRQKKKNIDILVLDCTVGEEKGELCIAEHNSIPMLKLLLSYLKKVSIVGENSQVYISHLAPTFHKTHEETEDILRNFGIKVAYDGLKI